MNSHKSLEFEGIVCSNLVANHINVLRLAWNNRGVRKDKFLIVLFLLVWIGFSSASVILTGALLTSNLRGQADTTLGICLQWFGLLAFLLVSWSVTFGLPYYCRGLFCREWIEISLQTITFGYDCAWFSEYKTFSIEDIDELSVGRLGDSSDRAATLSLFIWYFSPSRNSLTARTFGDWLAADLKIKVFDLLQSFVTENSMPLKMSRQTT